MSEPRLISPLLDGFAMGHPISSHNGVRCCPAMQDHSDKKYIVKIISIPASQVHTDALLLSGAYRDKASVQAYYKELADGVVREAEVLQSLSKLEGFVSYENWQAVPMQDEPGYDIYLTGSYKRSLERHFSNKPMTHLGAVNLGLDLCAALAVSRQSGYLCVNLKPGNVFITEDQRYKIGDLGFVPLSSLKYATLPDRYHSSWTAPEINDPFASLNTTVDIYALGLILYQAYNNGRLPFAGSAPSGPLPPPEYADYEMAEIIMRACAFKAEDRWQDPIQMGQALVAYMQRNSVNDTPIIPPVMEQPAEPDPAPEAADETPAEAAAPAEEAAADEPAPEETLPEEAPPAETVSGPEPPAEDDPADLGFIQELISDETAPTDESAVDIADSEVSEETSQMLAQADELIAHETPDPVVAPDPIEIPMPEPLPIEDPAPEQPDGDQASEPEPDTDADAEPQESPAPAEEPAGEPAEEAAPEEDAAPPEAQKRSGKNTIRSILITLLCLVLATAVAFGGYYFYKEYYLLTVDAMDIQGTDSQFTVTITSAIPDEDLTVVYTDTYGNAKRVQVVGGAATATDLAPSTVYKITLEVSGFHKLAGSTSGSYTTASRTNIVSLSAITGAEDGSALISFTVDGTDTEEWVVTYCAEGEDAKSVSFTGHMVTIRELTVGKVYSFQLSPASELVITGQTEITHTASKVICAENLKVDACHSGSMTVSWSVPEGAEVSGWTVRCYNNAGYDQTISTAETSAVFSGITDNETYTIEATAAGMTLSTHITMTSTPVEITRFQVNTDDPDKLNISWEAAGSIPQNGWILAYSIDGGVQEPLECSTNNAIIEPAVPGAHYELALQAADGTTVFNGTLSYDLPDASPFDKYGMDVTEGDITFDLHSESGVYSTSDAFASGETVYLHLDMHGYYEAADSDIRVLYVIRDSGSRVVGTGTDSFVWTEMWWNGYFEASVPAVPETAGSYTLDVFFDGELAASIAFSIS